MLLIVHAVIRPVVHLLAILGFFLAQALTMLIVNVSHVGKG